MDMLCAPGPMLAVRVEFMARQVPSQAENETSEDYETHFVRLLFINSKENVNIGVFLLLVTPEGCCRATRGMYTVVRRGCRGCRGCRAVEAVEPLQGPGRVYLCLVHVQRRCSCSM